MARVKFASPVDDLQGKINTPHSKDGGICVFRQKCFGVTARGKKILGPKESYVMYRHEGDWSVGAKANRAQFGDLAKRAFAELQEPERKAYWQRLFEEQIEHPVAGEKQYKMLHTFVAARLRAGL